MPAAGPAPSLPPRSPIRAAPSIVLLSPAAHRHHLPSLSLETPPVTPARGAWSSFLHDRTPRSRPFQAASQYMPNVTASASHATYTSIDTRFDDKIEAAYRPRPPPPAPLD